jgi:NSS family neurotransmitter:Na+ symporter
MIVAAGIDSFGWSRRKSALICLVILLVLSLPCALGYNVLSNVHLIG